MTTNFFYIKNDYNRCNYLTGSQSGQYHLQATGWHYISNQTYADYLNKAQWFDLVTNHEYMRPIKIDCIVQNLIPMTDQLAIQQNTTFLSFNNTIYALAYDDTCHETNTRSKFNSIQNPVVFREGIKIATDGTVSEKTYLPDYTHHVPSVTRTSATASTAMPNYFWDPLTRSTALMELRPGKNSIQFGWSCSDEDKHIWYDLTSGLILPSKYQDYTTNGSQINYSVIDRSYDKGSITPDSYALFDFYRSTKQGSSLAQNNTDYPGEARLWASQCAYKKPINNWFIKMIPIFDANKALLKHEGQICIVKKITFEVQPRKSAVNWPRIEYNMADTSVLNSNLTGPSYSLAVPKAHRGGYGVPDFGTNNQAYPNTGATTTSSDTQNVTTVTYAKPKK